MRRPARHRAAPRSAPLLASALAAALCAAAIAPGAAAAETFQTSAGPVLVEEIAGGLENPWGLAFLPSGALLVTEKPGRIVLIEDGRARAVEGAPEIWDARQGGLLDIAISPDFETDGFIFLTYAESAPEGARTSAMRARLTLEPTPRLSEQTVIFRQEPALNGGRHFGSRIIFADDGTLWIALGDRGHRSMVQDPANHVGKIVRLTKDGAVPPDNPHLGEDGVLPEIWSTGHRNIQGAVRHPETGALWTVEHGARGGDEINQPEAGKNYGWPRISYGVHYSGASIGEGTEAVGLEQPKFYWDPSIAPSGLALYDGDLFPEWRGDLFAGALKFRLISRLDVENGEIVGEEQLFEGAFGRIRDVRSGPDGALWFLTDSRSGGVYRVTPAN